MWYKYFRSSRTVTEDLPPYGRSSTANIEQNVQKMKGIVFENSCTILRKLVREFSLAYGKAQHILVHILCMRHVPFWLVPKSLLFKDTIKRQFLKIPFLKQKMILPS